jgi:uncharacterized damage-inducible protein DinB
MCVVLSYTARPLSERGRDLSSAGVEEDLQKGQTDLVSDLPGFYPDLQPPTERVALAQRLDFCRSAAVARIYDLDDERASRQPLPATNLTVGGVVRHLAWAEDRWFVGKLRGLPLPEPWRSAPMADQPDWPFESSRDDAVADVVALYREACQRSREAAGRYDSPDAVAAVVSFGRSPVTLRWLLVHVIEETAWHLGHLDLLRDGLGAPPAAP